MEKTKVPYQGQPVTQMTREEALAFMESDACKALSLRERAAIQLYQNILFMDWSDFQQGVEGLLGRPVWTHEFAYPAALREELAGRTAAPTMQQIIDMIPAEKRFVVVVPEPAQ